LCSASDGEIEIVNAELHRFIVLVASVAGNRSGYLRRGFRHSLADSLPRCPGICGSE